MNTVEIQVLLVEDSIPDALVVQDELAHLTGASFHVEHVERLNEALARLEAHPFDVVLLDLNLPDCVGFETFVRLHAAAPEVPVVVVSGRADGQIAVQAVQAGAQDYLVKGRLGEDVLMRSITYAIERQRSERRLAESEERYRLLVECSPDAYLVFDDGKIVFANAAARKLFGADHAEQLLGWSFLKMAAPESHEILRQHIINPGANASSAPTEILVVGLDGTSVEVEGTSNSFLHEGRPAVQVVLHDLTARKYAQRQISEQAALLNHAQDAIFVHDLDGCLSYWNNSAERVFGWTATEAIGSNVHSLLYARPEPYRAALETVLCKGDWIGEKLKLTKSGGHVLVESRWTLLRGEDGNPKAILAIDTDITEAKQIEGQLFRAQRMESIGTLAGGIAHDLNNVLAPMIMAVDLLRREETAPRDLKLLDMMEDCGKRGADMVKQVLLFARGIEGERSLVSFVQLVNEMREIVSDTFPKSICVDCDAAEEAWSTTADRTQLHQVLLNLCINARDAMPNGGRLSLRVRNWVIDEQFSAMTSDAKPGPYVVLEVEDTGQGMTGEVLKKMFEPFYTTKGIGKGTGLGLSTTLAIVKNHGGFITVESEPGKGTTFQVSLPAEVGSSEEKHDADMGKLPHGDGELILQIDDEASICTITAQTLEAFGYQVVSAHDGIEGIALYAQRLGEVAAVITDMDMPVMDGPAVIRILLRLNPEVKIIVASGSTTKGLAEEAIAIGAKHFMPKPYTAETMLRILYKLLHPVV